LDHIGELTASVISPLLSEDGIVDTWSTFAATSTPLASSRRTMMVHTK
jgi:hypothetical protein